MKGTKRGRNVDNRSPSPLFSSPTVRAQQCHGEGVLPPHPGEAPATTATAPG